MLIPDALLNVSNLSTHIGDGERPVRVVDGLDLKIRAGETFALLGESGCGKSMTALTLMRLLPLAGRIVSGRVRLGDTDLLQLTEREMRAVRGGRVGMIFQEPQTSLNPVLTVGAQIAEAVRLHHRTPAVTGRSSQKHSPAIAGAASLGEGSTAVSNRNIGNAAERQTVGGGRSSAAGTQRLSRSQIAERVVELLDSVGIPDPERRAGEYPHQLSGGMKQRVMIAMALAGNPELLIADEPTTALDVTIQAQVLRLLKQLQLDAGMAVLLITHDLGVVAETADRLAVMYAGQIVETADAAQFFRNPAHPYSRKLLESLPAAAKRGAELTVIPGRVPPLDTIFRGCRFRDRCAHAVEICDQTEPPWYPAGQHGQVRCHLFADGKTPVLGGDQGTEIDPAVVVRTEQGVWLNASDLKVHFPIHRGLFRRVVGHVKAVDGVSLALRPGRTLALVGESGCGKTTVGKAILQLLRPTGGTVGFQGQDLVKSSSRQMRRFRKDLQIIFQDPFASMNPRMLVGDIIGEGLSALGLEPNRERRRQRVAELLDGVGMDSDAAQRYPHEFSGGQRQRICIARALAVEPRIIVCDEPTSALDVSVQAQILNLLKDLQQDLGLAYLFITHDLSVVSYLAHEVAVMYLGRIVERGTVEEVLDDPRHPYTMALLSAVPIVDSEQRRQIIRLEGDMPSPAEPPSGCHFHPRCPVASEECKGAYPEETRLSDTRVVRCFAEQ